LNVNLTLQEQSAELQAVFERIKKAKDHEVGKIFAKEVLPM